MVSWYQAIFLKHSLQSLDKTFHRAKDVGFLTAKVIGARGLRSADFGGFSDPYVTLELGNSYSRTHTVYRNLDPDWHRMFTL